jgi:hypothetical protein
MDFVPLPLADGNRAGRTDADARAAAAAGILVQFRNKGAADARSETDRLFRAGITAGLACDTGFREAGFRYGD